MFLLMDRSLYVRYTILLGTRILMRMGSNCISFSRNFNTKHRKCLSLSNVLPSSLHSSSLYSITFEDGEKGSVLGSRYLNVPDFPKLRNVLLVDELKFNLISTSQLCDQDLFVKFTKDKCIVIDQDQHHIMEGNWSSDN